MNTNNWLKITSAALCLAALTTFAADLPEASPNPVQSKKRTLEPVIKKINDSLQGWQQIYCAPETVQNKKIMVTPVEAIRLVYTKLFDADTAAPAERTPRSAESAKRRFDHTDLLMIPTFTPSFQLQKALALENAVEEPGEKDLFLERFGIFWRNTVGEYKTWTLYLGRDQNFHYFGRGNLIALDVLRKALALNGGYDRVSTLIQALDVEDFNLFTSRYSVQELAKIGTNLIPQMQTRIDEILSKGTLSPIAQVAVIRYMNSPVADEILRQMVREGSPTLRNTVFQVVSTRPFRPELKDLFLEMLSAGRCIVPATEAVFEYKWQKEALPLYRRIINKPTTFGEYHFSVITLTEMMREKEEPLPIHTGAIDHIKLFAIRNGEIRDTPIVRNINETDAVRESRLEKEDRVRLKPYEDAIVNAPQQEMSIAAGFVLCLFKTGDPRVSQKYVSRVRKSGMNVLVRLPKEKVESVFRSFLKNFENDEELEEIRSLYAIFRAKSAKI